MGHFGGYDDQDRHESARADPEAVILPYDGLFNGLLCHIALRASQVPTNEGITRSLGGPPLVE
ncbi:MAG TPA: hypothetical protein VNX88_20645 [Terriglobales bacterium]|jgi:hypothetical protein|nr:hypothetical protein [Terriglobales bacterium]